MKNGITGEERIARAFLRINRLAENHELLKARRACVKLYRDFPEHPRVLQGMGLLLFRTEEQEEGERLVRRAIELRPDYADAYHNLGNMQCFMHRDDEGERMYRRAIELAPDHYKALSSLAGVLSRNMKCHEAIQCCEKALRIDPRYGLAYEVMGSVMSDIGKLHDAIRFFRKAISLRKNDAAHSCLLFNLNAVPDTEQREIFTESAAWGKRFTSPLTRHARPHLNTPVSGRRLRIGYVSGDFKHHPAAYHLMPVLASHNKTQVEVFLYHNFPMTDEITEELAGHADHFRDITTLPDEKAEEIIRHDGIDILVDLAGHTSYHRLHLFARRPAPVQVSWLGYFNTTGMTAIDYLLSDALTIPVGEEALYTEKIVRLPDCRFCYAPPGFAPEVAPLPSLRLGFVTFGSFNKITKTNDQVIALWARVLDAVPGSKLLLKWPLFKDSEVGADLRGRFAAHGIDAERLILRSNTPHPEMLAEYGDVDIALDTFPYNGGATTCEALWMGVPVVTLKGRTPIARQSTSFLHTVGYDEWVARTLDEYVEIAVRLAADKPALSAIRGALRSKMADSPLCDGKRFAFNLETAYRQMWEKWCLETERQDIHSGMLRRFSIEELYGAGVICMDDNDYLRASQFFQYVLKRKSDHIQASNNLGISMFMTGKSKESIRAFRRAIRHDKEFADAYSNLGRVLLELGESGKALKVCRRAVTIKPDHVDALIHLANACRDLGRIGEARGTLERVLEIVPDNVRVLRLLAIVMQGYGDIAKALELLRRALDLDPDNLEVISTLLMIMQYDDDTTQEALLSYGRRFGDILGNRPSFSAGVADLASDRDHLKVGFVSADFSNHPVGMLLSPLFRRFDPERLSLYCYNNGRRRDLLTDWYRSTATGWRDIFALSDNEANDLIRKDGIDILIDMSGHTDGYRLSLFSFRPAPLQATWMGYGHTTGLSTMDYIIADEDMIPDEDEHWFTERVMRLPHSRFCFNAPSRCPEVVEPPFEYNGYITFGCFNNVAKLSSQVIACWAKILQLVPRSRLILKWKTFIDKELRAHFREAFARHGISRQRVEFRTESNLYILMLEYGDIDIALDPFPFSGGMTSLEALWMGAPVITKNGALPISRQTSSFLRIIGLPELVADGEEEYISLAVELASDPERLKNIRASLRDRMIHSPLCDEKGFAASVQDLLFAMWRDSAGRGMERRVSFSEKG